MKILLLIYIASLSYCSDVPTGLAADFQPSSKDVHLYGVSGAPAVDDIRQSRTQDCFLEATLAAIVQSNPAIITNALHDGGNGTVSVQYVDYTTGSVVEMAQKKDLLTRLSDHDSASCWVQVIQDSIQPFFRQFNFRSDIRSGGFPMDVLSAFYGDDPGSTEFSCSSIFTLAAQSGVMVFCTSIDITGQLVQDHCYTVDSLKGDTLNLRNPWGFAGIDTSRGSNATDLGHGVLTIPVSIALEQCYYIAWRSELART